MTSRLLIALDRATVRHFDADGHMHVEVTNISKANVCPYFGREIPDWEKLGLDANRVYMLYRDPQELQRAAETFAGKPLLLHHKPVMADDHPEALVVGSIGTDVTFDGKYLRAPLTIWKREAIDVVESGEQRQLSPGYRYRADMTRGRSPEGVAYDGVMRDIKGNHLALVAEGRTGPDVMVADHPAGFQSMKFAKFFAALAGAVPTLTAEQTLALDAALAEDVLKRVKVEHCLTEDEMTAACDAYAKAMGKDASSLTDEDKAEAYKRAAADKDPHAATEGRQPQAADETAAKAAQDAAVLAAVDAAIKDTVPKADAERMAQDAATAARAEVHALYTARKAVEATVGVVALDSAEAVYRFALDHLKVDNKDIPAAALAALYEQSAKAAAVAATPVATDSGAFDPSSIYTRR